ncbi:MAG: ABC-F family ATP-binding cassette domain-containing protein [Bacteroidales bacterium]|nr:ABC-F family ATP-binding cassette domain-containing protein [Candidatus Cryptobacteroides aphodequi]
MILIDDVTLAYGSFVLLDKINFHISENDRIGLVGKNGAGKSTIMKLIMELQKPTSGHIDKPSHITIGYLPQIMEHHKGRSVLEETLSAFDEENAIAARIDDITRELGERSDYESEDYLSLVTELSDLNDTLNASHSEPPEVQARKTLVGLGFRENELGRLTETFSQGWNMRIELAKILLKRPQLLMLDEPTNHLDIESIGWLGQYLAARIGSLLLVSHDRKFLDTVTNRTIEIVLGRINDYKVPYSQYLVLRAERMAQQTAAYESQQRMIEKTEDFIARFRYKPTKSNQVQSRIKALEKLDRLEIDETDNATLTVHFPPAPRSGDVVYKASSLKVGYPQKVVFSGADIEIKRGEKVSLLGRNGEGKTTLMRVIMGELDPLEGESRIGHNVTIGYFAQNQEDVLDKNETVFSTLDRIAVGDIRTRLRDILAQFLFRGEDIDKRVSVLSGGERARLALAKLMLQSHNLLALDEPTNHMDIKSKDILKQALKAFDGTLVIVSHDRDFLDGLVDKFYEFKDGEVHEHLETIGEYLEARNLETIHELDRIGSSAPVSATNPSSAAKAANTQGSALTQAADKSKNWQQSREQSREQRRREQQIKRLEGEIEAIEAHMKDIERILSNPGPQDDVMELTRDYLESKRELDYKTDEWGSLL